MAKWIMLAGGLLLAIGGILQFAPWLLGWFGRLPGDIRVESERVRFYFPITSMVILSVIVSLLFHLLRR